MISNDIGSSKAATKKKLEGQLLDPKYGMCTEVEHPGSQLDMERDGTTSA